MRYTLITGASSGIGEEFARQFAEKKHNLILVARSKEKMETLAEELKKMHPIDIRVIAMDLGNSDSAEKLYEICKSQSLEINFLINDAGIGLIGKFDHFNLKSIEEMLNLNILTLTKLVYLFLPQLKKNHGCLINLAPQVAFTPPPYMSAYAGTKSYVLNFTEAIRVEYEKDGVRVLALCKGPTYTNYFARTHASPNDINFKFRDPKDVVEEAIASLESNKNVSIAGWENKVMTFLLRFIPRTLKTKYSVGMVNEEEKKS